MRHHVSNGEARGQVRLRHRVFRTSGFVHLQVVDANAEDC
jgi:hypothetical protein